MLEPILERLYEERGAYAAFSACVSRDGKGIMILGEKASGKSTLSFELSRKHGFSLIGDERCLLSGRHQPYIIGGNRLMVLRNDILEREGFGGERASENKAFIEPSEMGICVESGDVPIAHCFETKLSKNPSLRHYSQRDAALKLAKTLSRGIRGFDSIMLDFDYQVPSLDADELSRKRIGFAKLISRSAQFDEIRGDIEYLTSMIENSLV